MSIEIRCTANNEQCPRCGKADPAEIHTCQQPEALRLAEWLQSGADEPMWSDHTEMPKAVASRAAAELRRLHAENASLLEQNTMLDRKLAELERGLRMVDEALKEAMQ
jgi:hypothetical protein